MGNQGHVGTRQTLRNKVKYFHQKKRFIKSFCHIVSPHSQIKHQTCKFRYFKKKRKIAEYKDLPGLILFCHYHYITLHAE